MQIDSGSGSWFKSLTPDQASSRVNHDGKACPSPEREMAIVGALKIAGNNPNRKKLRLRIAVPTAEGTGEEKHSLTSTKKTVHRPKPVLLKASTHRNAIRRSKLLS